MKYNQFAIIIFMTSLQLFAENSVQTVDSRLKPGSRFMIDRPDLGLMWHDRNPVSFEVYLPRDYSLDRQYPLLAWCGGDVGDNKVSFPLRLTGGSKFVIVMLPYSTYTVQGVTGKYITNHGLGCNCDGHYDSYIASRFGAGCSTKWAFYEELLRDVEKVVPNIHPNKKIIGGFSSGGNEIMHLIGMADQGFLDYFDAYIVGGAGWPMGNLKTISGRPMLVYVGDKDTRYDNLSSIIEPAKQVGIDVEFLVFKETDHTIPDIYFDDIVDWMLRKVVYKGLDQAKAEMDTAMQKEKWIPALKAAKDVLDRSDPDKTEYKTALETIDKLGLIGASKWEQLSAKSPKETQLREFIADWDGCPCADKAREVCNRFGVEKLEKIITAKIIAKTSLKKFLDEWKGYPVYNDALTTWDALARKELEAIRAKKGSSSYSSKLTKFIEGWEPAPCTREAAKEIEELSKMP